MKKLPLIARLLLGLLFFVFGLNGFLHFIPMPAMPEKDMAVMAGFAAMEYFTPLLAGCQAICGLLLILGVFVPLALVVLAPIIINIFLYHIFVNRGGLGLAMGIAALEGYLAFFADPYRKIIKKLFSPR